MNDKYNGELHRLMMTFGFCAKFRDRAFIQRKIQEAGVEKVVTTTDRSGYPKGMADNVFVGPLGTYGAFIEAKTGDGKNRERFSFDKWTEEQRAFAGVCAWVNIPYLIFLSMGNRVGGVTYPRKAWIMSGVVLYDLELAAREVDRKSLSYKTAVERLSAYELTWDKGQWTIPTTHSIRQTLHLV